LVIRPLIVPELRCLFATLLNLLAEDRSGLHHPKVITMPSADFCCLFKSDHSSFSRESATSNRSPEVSSTAFRALPPDLQPAPLMDMGFVVDCQLAGAVCLLSGSCSSARAFAPRFLQTPPHDDALALR